MHTENLEQKLKEIAEQVELKDSSKELKEVENTFVRDISSLSEEELAAEKDSIETILSSIRKRLDKIKEKEREIDDKKRTKSLIDGPVKVILQYDEEERGFLRYRFSDKDEVIYVLIDGKKNSIFRASTRYVTDIEHMALSPDNKRLAFDCKNSWSSRDDTYGFHPELFREIYIMNIDGTKLAKIGNHTIEKNDLLSTEDSNREGSYHNKREDNAFKYLLDKKPFDYILTQETNYSPFWLDDKTIKFTRAIFVEDERPYLMHGIFETKPEKQEMSVEDMLLNLNLKSSKPEIKIPQMRFLTEVEASNYKAVLGPDNNVVGKLEKIG